jgi:hypothetical protein
LVPVIYKGKTLPLGFRADILVGNTILFAIKAVVTLLPTYDAQILTYLRMSQIPVGLLMNFHAIRLKDGLRRFVIWLVNTLRAPLWCLVFFVVRLARERASRNFPRSRPDRWAAPEAAILTRCLRKLARPGPRTTHSWARP